MNSDKPWYQILRRERHQHGWTQEEAAQKIGCENKKTVVRWENGKAFPTPYYRRQLAKVYGKSIEELGLIKDNAYGGPTRISEAGLLDVRSTWQENWGEAPHLDNFCGREQELAEVEQWIRQAHCRIVAVLGIGGVGKTTFVTKVAKNVKETFDYVFWRSLQDAPSVEYILESCLRFITQQEVVDLPESLDEQISFLIRHLREHRCLLILDNVDALLQAGQRVGLYRPGYEGYGRLFQRIAEADHQSCLLLTSREKPKEVALGEGKDSSPIRSLLLTGIGLADGQKLLHDKDLNGSEETWATFINLYRGNPLALKVVSEPIREVFEGNIAAFLEKDEVVIGDISDLLEHQFRRLSPLEQELMYWLAIEREAVSLSEIQADIVRPIAKGTLPDAFDSLLRRSIIERRGNGRFTLQPVIMEYVTEQFVEKIYKEIEEETIELLGSHALIKAQANDYVRESQYRFILAPLAERLLSSPGDIAITKKLQHLLETLHIMQSRKTSYAAGNILNLSIYLHIDLYGYDFSHLSVRQAHLQGIELPGVNFAYADLKTSLFTETFTSVLCVALSPNGKLLAAGTTTGEVLLRQVGTLTPLFLCPGHGDDIRSVAFSPDSQLLASGSEDQTIRLWNTITGSLSCTLHGHTDYVRSIAFSPDGSILASGSEDQTMRLWDYKTGQCLQVLEEHSDIVRSVAFSPDGNMLASGSNDQTIRLWDSKTGHCLDILGGHNGHIHAVVFSSDGNLIASGSEDRSIRIWDSSTSQCLMTLEGHTNRIRTIAFSTDGMLLASGSDDQTIRVWDTTTGQCLNAWTAHTNRIWAVTFLANETMLISASEDETVRCWEVHSGRCLKQIHGYTSLIKGVAFHPGGQLVASGNEDKTVRLWNVETGQCLRTLEGHENRVRTVAFSPTENILASGSEDETIRLWDAYSGQCLHILRGHTHLVRSVAFNSDGTLLVSGSFDQTIRLWQVSSGQCLTMLSGQGALIWAVAFNFDSNLIASGSDDTIVRIWDASSGECLHTLRGHTHRVWSVAFSPNSNFLISSSDDQTIRIWDASSGKNLNTLRGHTNWVRTAAISPDGKLIASGSHDQTIRIWEMQTGHCLAVLRGHSNCLCSVTFSPDGRTIASGSDDGTTKLWNIQTGECIKTFRSYRPYEQMDITGVRGLTDAQKDGLRALGAIEYDEQRSPKL